MKSKFLENNARNKNLILLLIISISIFLSVFFLKPQGVFDSLLAKASPSSSLSSPPPLDASELALTSPLLSEDGSWKWDGAKNDWVPNTSASEPSQRALKAASQLFIYSNVQDKKRLILEYDGKEGTEIGAIKNLALLLDKESEKLIYVETTLEKYISEQNRPVINYEQSQPDITIKPDTDTIKPNNRINCTSSQVGSSTYTNCY